MNMMNVLEFAEVYNMLGGIIAWQAAGYPVTTPPIPPTTVPGGSEEEYKVLEIVLKETAFGERQAFEIFIIVANLTDNPVSREIPVTITQLENPEIVTVYIVNAAMDPAGTHLFAIEEAGLPAGNYEITADDVSQDIFIGAG
ncbi:MAG: hypothetical protein JW954_07205 [Dehalococcoidaceae bacterium]|nr:hypothetical protein [Dehalococcoidaceae bacterium]